MPKDVHVLSATRIFIFKIDDLLLPQIQQVQHAIAASLKCLAVMRDAVHAAVIFQNGQFLASSGENVAVLQVRFAPQHLTITSQSDSKFLDEVFDFLVQSFPKLFPSGAHDLVTKDVSQLSSHLDLPVYALVPTPLRRAIMSVCQSEDITNEWFMPSINVRIGSTASSYPGEAPDEDSWIIAMRVSSCAKDRIFYSTAPLPTERHESYLASLELEFKQRNHGQ